MKAIMSRLNKVLSQAEEISIGIALLGATFLVFLNVILRFFFKAGLVWSDELVRYLMILITFVGCSVCVRSDNHISVDVLSLLIKGKAIKIQKIIVNLIAIFFSCAMCYFGFLLVQRAVLNPQISPGLKIPMFIPYLSIPLGFFLMTVRYIQVLVGNITGKDYFVESKKAKPNEADTEGSER